MIRKTKEEKRKRRHGRVRKKLVGSAERPRLAVHRSLNNIYLQVIDDVKECTIYSSSSLNKDFIKSVGTGSKTQFAEKLGEFAAEGMKKKGISKIAFDRSGYRYHGRVKALGDSLRKAGIEF